MSNNQDRFYQLIKTIETAQQALANEHNPENCHHWQELLNTTYEQLRALTHQHSVNEQQGTPDREI